LEKKRSSRTHKLKRLYKVGLTARVESSVMKKVWVRMHPNRGGGLMLLMQMKTLPWVNENVVEEIVDAAQVSTTATTITITTKEVTLAQAMADLKSIKPKAKGIYFRKPGESTTTIFSQQLQDEGLSHDKGKGILVELEKPLKKKDQLKLDEEIALKLQAEIDEVERLAREKDEANVALTEEWDDIRAKFDVDY
ncbi:hypothetical protein Tco_1088803, partial [Tanacetum coccineum]